MNENTSLLGELSSAIPEDVSLQEKVDSLTLSRDELEADKELIDSMGFVELINYKRSINSTINTLKDTKEAIHTIRNMEESMARVETLRKGTSGKMQAIPSPIAMANIQDGLDMDAEEISEFLDGYDESVQSLNTLKELCEKRIHEFDNIKKTSSFMNNEFVKVIKNTLSKIEESENPSRMKTIRIMQQNMLVVYKNGESLDFLTSQIPNKGQIVNRWLDSIEKEIKQSKLGSIQSIMMNVTENFVVTFGEERMTAAVNYLDECFAEAGLGTDAIYVFLYFLYLVHTDIQTRKKGTYKWVEMLFINIFHILDDLYDLPGGVTGYRENIKALATTLINWIKPVNTKYIHIYKRPVELTAE